jgi:ubiquinone/menaquinone biosynthesis C-methylase UbiE
MGKRSVSFDRAAALYDRTRVTDPRALAETVDLLERELASHGPILEIGVGTGALAIPVAERGIRVFGVDVSLPMLAQLRAKPGAGLVSVVAGDATQLPFREHSFGGAWARWVLHLIPRWRAVVDELCRVVAPGGPIVLEPGGYRGEWLDIWQRVEAELGPAVRHVGLDVHERGFADLDEAFAVHGAPPTELPSVRAATRSTLARFLEQARERSFSWTWRVDERALGPAIDRVEAWAHERYGDDLTAVADEVEMRWRAYVLP